MINITRRGIMFVLSSPSGAGKTTISNRLLELEPTLAPSISVTTRPTRPGEVDGRDYVFVSLTQFQGMVDRDELLESAEVFGHSYGTPKQKVLDTLAAGKDIIFDIDWQGARSIKEKFDKNSIISIFILPPSMQELERRLRARASDPEEVVQDRMKKACDEISHFEEYDFILKINSFFFY